MGKLSYDDKLRIQTFWEQGLGAKAVMSSYPDHKGWQLSFVKKLAVESTPLANSVQKDSAQAKISLKVVGGGATFLTHPVP